MQHRETEWSKILGPWMFVPENSCVANWSPNLYTEGIYKQGLWRLSGSAKVQANQSSPFPLLCDCLESRCMFEIWWDFGWDFQERNSYFSMMDFNLFSTIPSSASEEITGVWRKRLSASTIPPRNIILPVPRHLQGVPTEPLTEMRQLPSLTFYSLWLSTYTAGLLICSLSEPRKNNWREMAVWGLGIVNEQAPLVWPTHASSVDPVDNMGVIDAQATC